MADIGCATGDGLRLLQERFPQALPLALDYALPMLRAVQTRGGRMSGWLARWRGHAARCVAADVRTLPLASNSLDLIWSNLMLHWLQPPQALQLAFSELHRVLRPEGLVHFALLGPDTLKSLRHAARQCSAVLPAPTFLDMHDIGDMLATIGFADPVMEMELLTLTYRNPRAFLADQRRLGVRDGLLERQIGRLDWQHWRQVFAAWECAGDRLPAQFEIIYGHAWKMAPRTSADGRAIVRFQPTA
jgi:malonyl-CoA O-methyltransferase